MPLALFIPLGLIMDLVHEVGHGVWKEEENFEGHNPYSSVYIVLKEN